MKFYKKIFLFVLISIPFFLVGKALLISDHQEYIIRATKNAKDNRYYLSEVKAQSELVFKFKEENKRFPTMQEVSCDFKECGKYFPLFWDIEELDDKDFIISYHSPGVMFTPATPFTLEFNTKTGKSNFDHLLEPWQFKLWFFPHLIKDLCIMFLPFLILFLQELVGSSRKSNEQINKG